jgi:N-acetylglutamate synthase-like GNAT family acetyltransferase
MRTRKAFCPTRGRFTILIAGYSGDGTLLPRTLPEICENVRDFVVLEHDGRIIGCGALHLYGTHLAEIRSITVGPQAQGQGRRRPPGEGLLAEAKRHRVDCICLFTRKPDFFARSGILRWRSAKIFPTRFTRIATLVRGFIAATKWRWCAEICPSSRSCRSLQIGW